MKILVTGAAGFIGSNITKKLLLRGDSVVGIDNFNDYYPRNCKEFNIDLTYKFAGKEPKKFSNEELDPVYNKLKEFEPNGNSNNIGEYDFVEGNIEDYETLEKIFEGVDGVIHLAAMAGVPYSTKKPRLYTSVNVDGTVNLLDLSVKNNVKKFVFGSSSSVYGNREDRKVKESDDVSKPLSVYGATKVAGEVISHAFSEIHGLPVVIDRIFGPIYGPLQRPYGMLHQRAINYTHNNKELSIYGRHGIDTAKDSTYIDDQVAGLIKCLDADVKFEVFNIGTSNPLPIKTWFEAIEKAYGQPPKYQVTEWDGVDVISSADISKAKEMLGYEPKIDMFEGVKRQVEVFKLMPEWYKTMEKV